MEQDNRPRQGEHNEIICTELAHKDQQSLIFHLLYAADTFDYEVSLESIADNFSRGFDIVIPTDSAVFQQALAIIQQRQELDRAIQPLLDNWRFERLGTITRLIIRLSIWQLMNTSIDPAIIINEAVELAKCFAEKDAYKFINGILDEFTKRKLISHVSLV